MSTPTNTPNTPAAAPTAPTDPVLTGKAGATPAMRPRPTESAPPATAAKVEATVKKLLKLSDGKEYDEADIRAALQEREKFRGADQKFQTAAQMRAEAAAERAKVVEVVQFLRANPKEALAKLGVDLRTFSEETLTEILVRENETPQARAQRLRDEDHARLRREDEQRKALAKRAKEEAEQTATRGRLDKMFCAALELSGLKPSPRVIGRMATLAKAANRAGHPLNEKTAAAIATLAREDFAADLKESLGAQEPSAIEALLGDELIRKLVKHRVSKLKSAKPTYSKPIDSDRRTPAEQDSPKGSWASWTRKNRNL